ncbi:hypothetical protein [Mesorhizobium sp.]|nr:hypothetical protein [Mesorhizobium sp.]
MKNKKPIIALVIIAVVVGVALFVWTQLDLDNTHFQRVLNHFQNRSS